MGARLSHFWPNWTVINADPWIINVLRSGYFLPFDDELPPLTTSPPELSYSHNHPLFQELQAQVQKLLTKQAIEPVLDNSPGFYSRLFLAPKKTGDWRPVIDLSTLNRYITAPRFKMETVASILDSMQTGTWCTSLDLQDAFLHVPIAKRHRKYLRFKVQGQSYQFRALPFGLTTSPYVFTRIVKAVGAYARSHGLSILQYLDDWSISCADSIACSAWTKWLLDLVLALGLLVNLPKCDLDPAQLIQFVGILFDLIRGLARPADHRIDKFLALVKSFLQQKTPPASSWQQLLGHMTSLERLVPRGRLHMRPMQFHLQETWPQDHDDPDAPIPVNEETRQTLKWWSDPKHLLKGVPLDHSPPQVIVFTDASTEGWGAHLDQTSIQTEGIWSPSQQELHINNLELLAAFLALQQFLPHVRNKRVLLMTDNTTVVGHIKNQGGTHSRSLYLLTLQLFTWTDQHGIILVPRHIPGHLNVLADRLSRRHQIIQTEWSLSQSIADRIWKVWGRPHVDMFATRENSKLPTFVSPFQDNQAWRTDALSFSWTGMWMYLYPPIPLLHEVLLQIAQTQCEAILIAPAWPTQNWFPLLLDLCSDAPLSLPPIRTLLRQPGTNTFHQDPAVLQLHAWRLSGPRCVAKDSLRRQPNASRKHIETVHKSSTTADGVSSVSGALTSLSILSRPLPR